LRKRTTVIIALPFRDAEAASSSTFLSPSDRNECKPYSLQL
jgi:hypothetical protein